MLKTRITLMVVLLVVAGAVFGRADVPTGSVDKDEAAKVTKIVQDSIDKVQSILGKPDYNKPEKRAAYRAEVRAALIEISDMRRISILTLGREKRDLSADQFDQFVDLFSQLLFSTYITHLEKADGQSLAIRKIVQLSQTRVEVQTMSTKVKSSDKEIPIGFSFYKKGETYKLDDMTVEGISMVRNYRSQFIELLGKMKPDDFLNHLRGKAEELDKNEETSKSN